MAAYGTLSSVILRTGKRGTRAVENAWFVPSAASQDAFTPGKVTVCPRCYGVKFCVISHHPNTINLVESLAPEGNIRCEERGLCANGETECIFEFRSSHNDCVGNTPSDILPSDSFWSTVCAVAAIPAVTKVTCYYLE